MSERRKSRFAAGQEHVLFVVNNYPPHTGGVEQHVHSLATALIDSGHSATVVTLAETASDGVEDGVRVIRMRRMLPIADVLSFPRPGVARRILKVARSSGVTAISTHTRFFPMTWLGVSLARRLGVPAIHTEHGSDFVRSSSLLISIASRIVDATFGRSALRRATRIVGVSEAVVAFVARLAHRDAEVFYNAIDLGELPPAAHATGRLVFVGRLVEGKGWDVFLHSVARLRDRPDLRVDVLGDGPERVALERLVARLDVGHLVAVRGNVPRAAVLGTLNGAVLVNLSRLAEGFQTTLLEAAAVGAQIVSSPVPGLQALAESGAPIRVTSATDDLVIAQAMAAALDDPLPAMTPEQVARWGWNARSAEYLRIVASTRADALAQIRAANP